MFSGQLQLDVRVISGAMTPKIEQDVSTFDLRNLGRRGSTQDSISRFCAAVKFPSSSLLALSQKMHMASAGQLPTDGGQWRGIEGLSCGVFSKSGRCPGIAPLGLGRQCLKRGLEARKLKTSVRGRPNRSRFSLGNKFKPQFKLYSMFALLIRWL